MKAQLTLEFNFREVRATTGKEWYDSILQTIEDDGNIELLSLLRNTYFREVFENAQFQVKDPDAVAYKFDFGW